MTANKVPTGATQSKAAPASCCAMTPSAYNGTPAQPQPQTMGAARRDPRRGEIPGGRRQTPVRMPPMAREVVSNRAGYQILMEDCQRQPQEPACDDDRRKQLLSDRIDWRCEGRIPSHLQLKDEFQKRRGSPESPAHDRRGEVVPVFVESIHRKQKTKGDL